MKNIIYVFIYSIVCIIFTGFAQLGAQDTRYAGAFLELGIGARGLSMGEAYVAVADDGSAFYWNPAGIATLSQSEVSGMYASLFKGLVKHFHIGYTRPLYNGAAVSLNWVRLSVPDIPIFDSPLLNDPNSSYDSRVANAGNNPYGFWRDFALTQDALGFSDSNEDAFFITLAKQSVIDVDFGWQYFVMPVTIPVGLNIKLLRQNLFDKQGSGIGFDFGTMLKFGLDDLLNNRKLGRMSLGLAIKDLFNTTINWNTDSRHSDKIRRSWHVGGSYLQPLTGINGTIMIAYSYQTEFISQHNIGLEYSYYDRLALRFGLTDGTFTTGVGLNIAPFRIDYAFRSHDLGGSHRINTAVNF
jgi:hypothetical protein